MSLTDRARLLPNWNTERYESVSDPISPELLRSMPKFEFPSYGAIIHAHLCLKANKSNERMTMSSWISHIYQYYCNNGLLRNEILGWIK